MNPGQRALLARAEGLSGRTLEDIARALGERGPVGGLHGKGTVGGLLERALGATAGALAGPDFPELGVELKTLPIDPAGAPLESTFVCRVRLADADRAEWETSVARAKLACVLWIPVIGARKEPATRRTVGRPLLWRPSREQEAILRADFEDLMGAVGFGGIEAVTAHAGRWLQLRPKAANGRARTLAFGPGGERLLAVPRGFYLRPRFTGALLTDPHALPP